MITRSSQYSLRLYSIVGTESPQCAILSVRLVKKKERNRIIACEYKKEKKLTTSHDLPVIRQMHVQFLSVSPLEALQIVVLYDRLATILFALVLAMGIYTIRQIITHLVDVFVYHKMNSYTKLVS